LPGEGITGGGTLTEDITISLNIEGLEVDVPTKNDYIPFYSPGDRQYKGLISEFPFVLETLGVYTPLFTDPNTTLGGGLRGGGTLEQNLYIELDIPSLDVYPDTLDPEADYLAIFDASTGLHKKVLLSNLPYASEID